MRLVLLSAFLFVSFFQMAYASSPGMIEGPPGCSWAASVAEVGTAQMQIRLETRIGSCMYEPEPCGKVGDIIIAASDPQKPMKAGDTLQVWIDTDTEGSLRANMEQPVCTKTPNIP